MTGSVQEGVRCSEELRARRALGSGLPLRFPETRISRTSPGAAP